MFSVVVLVSALPLFLVVEYGDDLAALRPHMYLLRSKTPRILSDAVTRDIASWPCAFPIFCSDGGAPEA